MAPRNVNDLKQEEILQAVVIADSFNVRFGPATERKPRALLPLVNTPMIDYTLDYLASEGIQETFIFCCHLADQIRAHIGNSKWTNSRSSMTVKTILVEGCRSVGDALREIDSRSLIRNDFFLLGCDTIANVNLKGLMKEHKSRREQIKSSVMTMTYMKVKPHNRMRCREDNVLLAVEPGNQRICHYQRVTLDRKIKLPMELFHENADFVIHQDLLDSQLYLCSPAVLHLFTDNFDYCSVEDFVKGILINEEILGNTIHVHVLKDKYCARVTNPYMYDIISQDIIKCKTQPINPRLQIGERTDTIYCYRNHIYQGSDVTVTSGVQLKQNVVIGKGSTIRTKTEISDSVIGRNCVIGANVKLKGCYLWDNVTIEDGCEVTSAILCSGVVVCANTIVKPRTILSWNVQVGPDVILQPNLRLQDTPYNDEFVDDENEDTDIQDVTPEFGLKSQAFKYATESCSDDEDEQFSTDWGESLLPINISREEEEDDVSSIAHSDEDEDFGEGEDDFGMFYTEMLDTLKRAKEENISVDNLILEINSLKHAYNIAISDVHQAVVKVLVEVPAKENVAAADKVLMTAVLKHIESYKNLLKHYIKQNDAQLDCLNSLEDLALEDERMLSVLPKIIHYLYNSDILEEPAIMEWYNNSPETEEEEEHSLVRQQMAAFITWLKEAEEESD